MFRGSSVHTLDPKGRLIVPTRFRDVIRASGSEAIMIARMDQCLYAYILSEWSKVEERIMTQAEMSDHMRRFRRVFVGGAFECVGDKQGRVLVPPTLRKYAGLEKDIMLVGALHHFEIWSKEKWDQENDLMESSMQQEEVRNEISKLGL